MKRGNRKGQFYLIAAIIIIVIIFGIFSARNYINTENKKTIVYDFKKEFGLEGESVFKYSLYNSKDTASMIDNWTNLYLSTAGTNLDDFIFVYGNSTTLTVVTLNETCSSASLGSAGGRQICYQTITRSTTEAKDSFTINVANLTYQFKLQADKNFIFLIKEGENVATS